ncbi:hypothetical protein CYR40_22140 [Chimaeribacter arupi]|uniref:TIGR04086 family membrane protein n=2 Tax=Yersiniaceae TaxID=1903411 RepID=A0A2N5EQZ8_9GAMM|nr:MULTISPECIES: hypothetical protein [Yersiniaceae]MBS0970944.1 hypothetical protein [Nissabacter archeti]MDV5139119.1 hypothetical protein [Chimaeribacter arupi]PLR36682.1 hypothetical protein CYR23_07035 [Chimaeribacter arupi]PLR41957.1 hypothetical protein CYR40_22140 [Chimaeribacter arupi]PLR42620.1 hypothetical protein CYR52_21110 [Chimaeribacter arupi]
MTNYDANVITDNRTANATLTPLKRISWSAVFAGVILSMVAYLLLSMLGTAIGASTIDPLQEGNPFSGLSTGAAIWMVATILISCAVGGYVAGRLAQREGMLHGLLVWGVNTLVCTYLVLTVFTSAVGGAVNVAGSGLRAVGSGISNVTPQATQMIKDQLQQANINLDDLQGELETTLRQTGKPELQPENLEQQANTEANTAQNQATNTAQAPDQALNQWLTGVMGRGESTLQAADVDALKNIIKARTGKSDQEVDQIVQRAQQSYAQAYQKYQELKGQAEQKAREAADVAADGISKASWYGFFMLIIGGVVAGAAGAWGRRTQPRAVTADHRKL